MRNVDNFVDYSFYRNELLDVHWNLNNPFLDNQLVVGHRQILDFLHDFLNNLLNFNKLNFYNFNRDNFLNDDLHGLDDFFYNLRNNRYLFYYLHNFGVCYVVVHYLFHLDIFCVYYDLFHDFLDLYYFWDLFLN